MRCRQSRIRLGPGFSGEEKAYEHAQSASSWRTDPLVWHQLNLEETGPTNIDVYNRQAPSSSMAESRTSTPEAQRSDHLESLPPAEPLSPRTSAEIWILWQELQPLEGELLEPSNSMAWTIPEMNYCHQKVYKLCMTIYRWLADKFIHHQSHRRWQLFPSRTCRKLHPKRKNAPRLLPFRAMCR